MRHGRDLHFFFVTFMGIGDSRKKSSSSRLGMGRGASFILVSFLFQKENVSDSGVLVRMLVVFLMGNSKGEIKKKINCYKHVGRMLTHEG